MTRKGQSFKKKTVTRWTLSYLLATFIPLLLVLVTALVTLRINVSSVTYANSITASLVQSSFSDVIERINEIKAEMIVDTDFDELRRAESLEGISSLDLYYHTADIRRLEQTSLTVETLFLYSPVYDWYISDQEWGNLDSMSSSSVGLSSGEVGSFLRNEIWDVSIHDLEGGDRILLLLPMTYIRSSNPNSLCVGVIVSRESLFSAAIDDYHDVVIYSGKRSAVVYSLSGEYDREEENAFFSSLSPGTTDRMGDVIVSVGEKETENLRCMVLMNRKNYFRSYYLMIELISVVIFLAAVSGGVLTVRNVRKDWILYSEAMKASGVDVDEVPLTATDYSPFVSSVSDLKAETRELSDVISRQKTTLTESALHKLVNGDSTVTKEVLSSLGVELISLSFAVVILRGKVEMLSSLLPSSPVLPFQSEYGEAFIVNAADSDRKRLQTLTEEAEKCEGIDSLALSDVHEGLGSVRDAYMEAIIVSEYEKDHELAFLSYQTLSQSTGRSTFQYTLEENMLLQKAIKDGDSQKAREVVEKVIERNRANGVSPKTLRFLLFSISGTIIRTVNGLDERYREVVPRINFPPILQSQNFQKSLSGVEEIIDSTCYSIKAIQETLVDSSSETYLIYRKVLEYVTQNYSEAMMNVSSVADHFNISIAYLSRVFKKYHGINISEYITGYRLDRAKELLGEGAMVGEVVEKCGFGSLRTFLRVFKSVEGITPGQYKSSVSKES